MDVRICERRSSGGSMRNHQVGKKHSVLWGGPKLDPVILTGFTYQEIRQSEGG